MAFKPALAKFLDFQDADECARVRAIRKEDIANHPNPDFQIRVIEDLTQFYAAFALDIVSRIVQARFNMDEYADEDGNTAPADWEGSFATAMWAGFFGKIDEKLRPKQENIHFPNTANINDYSQMIADTGGADCCYGGIGWCGHIAFWESSLGHNYDTMEEYKAATAQIVELTPMTIMQNALHSFGGDWSWVPPKAASIAPADILGAKHRSFWLDGMCGPATTMSWQRFIARLVAHGPVNKFVPGSILQEVRTDYTILGGVADNVEIDMS